MEESSFEDVDVCDTELCLSPGSGRTRRPSSNPASSGSGGEEKEVGKIKAQEKDQQITIFYNGRICICDVTDVQARAIISMAEKQETAACNSKKRPPSLETAAAAASPPAAVAPPQLLNRSLSLKRSLQRFLQKRKTRSLESSPYDHNNNLASP